MNHSPDLPATREDVAIQRWVTLRHAVICACVVACFWMVTDCSKKWIDKQPVKVEG